MKKRSILILFLSVIGLTSFAYPSMIVEHYTAERGLPNNIVNCTLKGSEGFVWFGTWYGLCSFDGTKFRSYDNRDGFYSADIPPRKIQRIGISIAILIPAFLSLLKKWFSLDQDH